MLGYLTSIFDPETPIDAASSLAIALGERGARLTHSHARQYAAVLCSETYIMKHDHAPSVIRNMHNQAYTLCDSRHA